jgi:hypothetical protein
MASFRKSPAIIANLRPWYKEPQSSVKYNLTPLGSQKLSTTKKVATCATRSRYRFVLRTEHGAFGDLEQSILAYDSTFFPTQSHIYYAARDATCYQCHGSM